MIFPAAGTTIASYEEKCRVWARSVRRTTAGDRVKSGFPHRDEKAAIDVDFVIIRLAVEHQSTPAIE